MLVRGRIYSPLSQPIAQPIQIDIRSFKEWRIAGKTLLLINKDSNLNPGVNSFNELLTIAYFIFLCAITP